jgi:hypothetical protein
MKKYYYAGGVRVAMRTGAAANLWLLGDHLGSSSVSANGTNGAKLAEIRYKPWGRSGSRAP